MAVLGDPTREARFDFELDRFLEDFTEFFTEMLQCD